MSGYSLTKPCELCPFRRGNGLKLYPQRARAFAEMMLNPASGEFPCHKTASIVDGEFRSGPTSAHCAGALIFAEKNGNETQMMRIAGRLGMYDPSKLTSQDQVFDTLDEMVSANKRSRKRPAKGPERVRSLIKRKG